MRSEKEMFDLILHTAEKDERIRAVIMNGSRTNPTAPKDIFQDYDIVYVVTAIQPFVENKNWIDVFGELLMKQEPDAMDMLESGKEVGDSYAYLMLFKDGNRIDLTLTTIHHTLTNYDEDKLTIPLLDKDNILPPLPAPSDRDYHVKKPSEKVFNDYTNEFWWCLQNVAKGLWRDEIPYARSMFEFTSRECLHEMMSWWIGMNTNFRVSTGKMGKYFKDYLPETYWEMYLQTFSDSSSENYWESIFAACELFRLLAKEVATYHSYTYPSQDDANMTSYLKQVRQLPLNSREIF